MSTPAPAAAHARRALPGRRTTVLAGTAASALLAGTTRAIWIEASAPDLTGTAQQVSVNGADAAPAVLALALVAVAASLATSLSSSWLRLITGPALLLAGAGAAFAALGVTRAPEDAAGAAVATSTGVVGSAVTAQTTFWPLLTLVPAVAVAAVGVLVLVAGRSWKVGTRYRSAAVVPAADPANDPAAVWDALSRGEDPSLEEEPSLEEDPSLEETAEPDSPAGEGELPRSR